MSRRSLPKNMRGTRARKLRRKLAARLGGSCLYCGRRFGDLHTATFDHFIPWSVWRTNRQTNLVLACLPCNARKADALPWPLVWLLLANADRITARTSPSFADYAPALAA